MSKVTTLMLHTGQTCDDEDTAVAQINAALLELDGSRHDDGSPCWWFENLGRDARNWGGSKRPADVWGGGFNHFPFLDLARIMVGIRWETPDAVSLMAYFEDAADLGFTLYCLDDLQGVVERPVSSGMILDITSPTGWRYPGWGESVLPTFLDAKRVLDALTNPALPTD